MKMKLIYPIGISLVMLLSLIIYKSKIFQNQEENSECLNYDYLIAKVPEGEKNFKLTNSCKDSEYIILYLYITILKNNYNKLILELINENNENENSLNITLYSKEKEIYSSNINYLELDLDNVLPGKYFMKIIEKKGENPYNESNISSSNLLIKYAYSFSENKIYSNIKNKEIIVDNNLKTLNIYSNDIIKSKINGDLPYLISDSYSNENTFSDNFTVTRIIKYYKEFPSDSYKFFKFNFTIEPDKKLENTSDYRYYKFVKLIINNKNNNNPRKIKSIYASTKESFYTLEDKYEENYEFKVEGKDDNLILTIPFDRLKNGKLYIKFSYNHTGTFSFTCNVEDGRRIEGIAVNPESCYDIFLDKLNFSDPDSPKTYRFLFSIDQKQYPLITFTTTSTKNFTLFMSGLDNKHCKDSFVNGYAFIPEYRDSAYYEYHTFLVQPREDLNLHICHRVINLKNATKIYVGDKIYSNIKYINNYDGEKICDCFKLENEGKNYSNYSMNYITKTKNLKMNIKLSNGESNYIIFQENSGTLFLDGQVDSFCFCQTFKDISYIDFDIYSSIYFQILGIENGEITQNLNAPLIKGFAMEQKLQNGQILFYGVEQLIQDINYNLLFFQSFSGQVGLYESSCQYFDKCSFSHSDLNKLKKINYTYENNIYLKEKIKHNNDIYQKYNSSVFIVYCQTHEKNGTCEYLIGITDEKTALVLSPNRKIYSFIKNENDKNKDVLNFTFIFSIFNLGQSVPKNMESISYFHFELHSLVGNLSDIKTIGYVSEEKQGNSSFYLNNRDNKSYHYIDMPIKNNFVGNVYFNFLISGKNNTFFYVRYNVISSQSFIYPNQPVPYKLIEKEMHHNCLIPKIENFSYFLPEGNNSQYVLSISGINSYIYNSIDNNKNSEKKYTQINNMKSNSNVDIYCLNEADTESNYCEYIISPGKLEEHILKKNIEYDGFYQYYKIDNEIKSINLYYYFSDDEIDSKRILVNVNKNTTDELIIEYGFNTQKKLKNKTIYKHNEIFIIELTEVLKPKKSIVLEDLLNEKNYFIIKLTPKNPFMEIRIKTNIKNKPTYLEPEKIELGYLSANESLYYYFDYFYKEKKEFDFEELYINNKGNVKSKIVMLKGFEWINNSLINFDEYEINYDNQSIIYDDKDSGNNHFKIFFNLTQYINLINNKNITDALSGLRVYLKLYLSEPEKESNINNKNNLFTIYRIKQKEKNALLVELNSNMYGHLYSNNEENYYFYTDIKNLKGDLIISLNCINCKLYIKNENSEKNKCKWELTSNSIIKNKELNISNYIYYSISGEKGYYYFSISDSHYNSIRYIEQLEPEMCYKSCNFIFPLHNYYNYSNSLNDKNDQTKLILFVPDNEKVKISYNYSVISEFENDNLEKLDWAKLKQNDNKFNNKLIINLKLNDIKTQEKYLMIHAESEEDSIFNIIMNKFIFSKNTEDIKPLKNIVYLDGTEENKKDILSLENDTLYKISLYLLNGRGSVSLDSSGKYEYYLNNETQKSISIYVKLSSFSISAKNLEIGNNFIFFINATKINDKEEIEEVLEEQKNYKIMKYRDESNKNNTIFPLKIRISTKNQKDKHLFFNYRFIELEQANRTRDKLYETTEEIFNLILDEKSSSNINFIENKYYSDLRRGYFSLEIPKDYNSDYISLIINKNLSNSILYNKLFLEIIPLYIGKENLNEQNNEKIYIPKNTYIQLDVNKSIDLIFSEINQEYNTIEIDFANTTEINITNLDEFTYKDNFGKRIFSPKNENNEIKTEYIMKLQPSNGTILLKYSTKKNDSYNFYIKDTSFESTQIKEEENINSFTISHDNLVIPPIYNNSIDYIKITFFIRLFNYLDFKEGKEIDNILIKNNALASYRKELSNEEKNNNQVNYTINFRRLEKKRYYINIIGAVSLNDSIEYFAFKSNDFEIMQKENGKPDKNWIIYASIGAGVVLIAVVIIIIIIVIKKRKAKKNDDIQMISGSDIVINLAEIKD